VIYFIHDKTSRTIKIGCARDPVKRLATLQISTPNELALLGTFAGTKRTEKRVHDLVWKHCAPKPGEPRTRPLRVRGEWYDDRILPFVAKLMSCPKEYLAAEKNRSADRPVSANRDPSIHRCKIVLVFDSGETYQEHFILKAGSADLALAALNNIANARLNFLAHTVQITELNVPGCLTKNVSFRGAFPTQKCLPWEGLSVIFNSEPGNGWGTWDGVKRYSTRWLHGVPREWCQADNPRFVRPAAQFFWTLASDWPSGSLLHEQRSTSRQTGAADRWSPEYNNRSATTRCCTPRRP
jgi:hypothetical protein